MFFPNLVYMCSIGMMSLIMWGRRRDFEHDLGDMRTIREEGTTISGTSFQYSLLKIRESGRISKEH